MRAAAAVVAVSCCYDEPWRGYLCLVGLPALMPPYTCCHRAISSLHKRHFTADRNYKKIIVVLMANSGQ